VRHWYNVMLCHSVVRVVCVLLQHDLYQLLARCWSTIRRCGRREQTPPTVGLALGLGVHHCARVIVARPRGASRPPDDILLQNTAIGPLRRVLYAHDENQLEGGNTEF